MNDPQWLVVFISVAGSILLTVWGLTIYAYSQHPVVKRSYEV